MRFFPGNTIISKIDHNAPVFEEFKKIRQMLADKPVSRCVTMLRFGPAQSQLVIEKGTRHICHYETGVGAMTLGVAADEIEHNLTDEGGEASFSYTLDTDAQLLSRNCVRLRVRLADSCRS